VNFSLWLDNNKISLFMLAILKHRTAKSTTYAPTSHYTDNADLGGNPNPNELGRFDSDNSIWYSSGYTALANFFR
jgi:hypothetical protein